MKTFERNELVEFARQMPKVELHVHLEGSIRPETLLELARRNGAHLPVDTPEGMQDFYRFRNFDHFIEVYFTISGCLRTPEDYELIAYEFGSECARQNIRYAEPTFTMTTNVFYSGLPWQTILEGLNAGRAKANQDFGVDWRWIFDINRNHPETQAEVLEITLASLKDGVVALGLGGSEADYPAELFLETFQRAEQAGLHRAPHSGETSGPESIWVSLTQLHAERIGHGVRCIEDPQLVEYLRENRAPLEICPTSNICLGIYPSYTQHPLRKLWEAGLLITVNSDDPPMFGTDLNREYSLLVEQFGFERAELEQVSLNAVRASFLPKEAKRHLEKEFREEFNRLAVGSD